MPPWRLRRNLWGLSVTCDGRTGLGVPHTPVPTALSPALQLSPNNAPFDKFTICL